MQFEIQKLPGGYIVSMEMERLERIHLAIAEEAITRMIPTVTRQIIPEDKPEQVVELIFSVLQQWAIQENKKLKHANH